jgi:formylglycine-generating enzyme required for sulfatase activity
VPATPKQRIFISYRREDTKYPAQLLYERLVAVFGGDCVFMDISDIPFGVNFRDHIRERMQDSAVCLALIGPLWVQRLQDRADDPRDFVRIELELAHELGVRVVPVTLDDAPMPRQEELPPSLWPLQLPDINSHPIRGGADLQNDLKRLVGGLESLLGVAQQAPNAKERPSGRWSTGLVLAAVVALLAAGVSWWGMGRDDVTPGVGGAPPLGPSDPAERVHRLQLEPSSPAAEVEINGEAFGRQRVFELPSGEHRVLIHAPGFMPFDQAVTLDADRRLTVELEPLLHDLTVRSNVYDDRVLIDGRVMGSTPLQVALSVGPHQVRVEKEGYTAFERSIELSRAMMVRAELQPLEEKASAVGNGPQTAVALRRFEPGDTFSDPLPTGSEGPPMRAVAGGRFSMGSPRDEVGRRDNEGPRHAVQIAAFAIGIREVTVAEFRQFIDATGYRTIAERGDGCEVADGLEYVPGPGMSWRDPGYPQADTYPVVCVTHADARAYLAWLSEVSGRAYRLPSEAEWEYAARGGTQSSRWWGDRASDACAYANVLDRAADRSWLVVPHDCNDRASKVAPVASYQANGSGLFDTLGNVWEWVADCWHDSYAGAPGDGSAWRPEGVEECPTMVARGGGWEASPHFNRSAVRVERPPDIARFAQGFRVAADL